MNPHFDIYPRNATKSSDIVIENIPQHLVLERQEVPLSKYVSIKQRGFHLLELSLSRSYGTFQSYSTLIDMMMIMISPYWAFLNFYLFLSFWFSHGLIRVYICLSFINVWFFLGIKFIQINFNICLLARNLDV